MPPTSPSLPNLTLYDIICEFPMKANSLKCKEKFHSVDITALQIEFYIFKRRYAHKSE